MQQRLEEERRAQREEHARMLADLRGQLDALQLAQEARRAPRGGGEGRS